MSLQQLQTKPLDFVVAVWFCFVCFVFFAASISTRHSVFFLPAHAGQWRSKNRIGVEEKVEEEQRHLRPIQHADAGSDQLEGVQVELLDPVRRGQGAEQQRRRRRGNGVVDVEAAPAAALATVVGRRRRRRRRQRHDALVVQAQAAVAVGRRGDRRPAAAVDDVDDPAPFREPFIFFCFPSATDDGGFDSAAPCAPDAAGRFGDEQQPAAVADGRRVAAPAAEVAVERRHHVLRRRRPHCRQHVAIPIWTLVVVGRRFRVFYRLGWAKFRMALLRLCEVHFIYSKVKDSVRLCYLSPSKVGLGLVTLVRVKVTS